MINSLRQCVVLGIPHHVHRVFEEAGDAGLFSLACQQQLAVHLATLVALRSNLQRLRMKAVNIRLVAKLLQVTCASALRTIICEPHSTKPTGALFCTHAYLESKHTQHM